SFRSANVEAETPETFGDARAVVALRGEVEDDLHEIVVRLDWRAVGAPTVDAFHHRPGVAGRLATAKDAVALRLLGVDVDVGDSVGADAELDAVDSVAGLFAAARTPGVDAEQVGVVVS